jgi:hypothetical protein
MSHENDVHKTTTHNYVRLLNKSSISKNYEESQHYDQFTKH